MNENPEKNIPLKSDMRSFSAFSSCRFGRESLKESWRVWMESIRDDEGGRGGSDSQGQGGLRLFTAYISCATTRRHSH
jgi:hypothetical protein